MLPTPKWILHTKISSTAKLVYAYLGSRCMSDAITHCSNDEIANYFNITTRSVNRATFALRKAGYVSIRRPRHGAEGNFNEYSFLDHKDMHDGQ